MRSPSDEPVSGPGRAPLRVMHLVHRFGVGGMEIGIAKLVNGLDPSRIASTIFSALPMPGDGLRERLNPGIRVIEFNRRSGNDPALVAELYRLFRRERPHVVHTHRWATLCEGLVAARLARVPFIVHGEHGTLETRRHNARVQRWAWRYVDRVLSVSSRLAERMASEMRYPLDRITVIRNGVDLRRFQPRDQAAARLALGLPPAGLVIGTVGRLVPVKDHPTFLHALARLRDRGVTFSAVIAGTGPDREQTQALARSLDLPQVRLLGNRDDVEQVLAAMDLFVLSSASEGLSNTIQEAMACGLPVVATRVGGADELVDHGRTGMLVPPGDPSALGDAIAASVRDAELRARMGRAARERAHLLFGVNRMLQEYEAMYFGLGGGRPRLVRQALESA